MATQEAQKRHLEQLVRSKVQFGDFPDGPLLEVFDPLQLAEALEQQAVRAIAIFEVPKVDLRMDAGDALKLAAWLRQAPGRGN